MLRTRLVVLLLLLLVGIEQSVALGEEPSLWQSWQTWARAYMGDASAQSDLGWMYSHGKGVPQDYAEAVKWYRLATAQGDAMAQHNLGWMYWKGEGVPQDYVQAHKWSNLATARATGEDRDKAAKMTPKQIAEAQRLAREWKLATPGK